MARRPIGTPGPAPPAGTATCTYDAGEIGSPPCGKPGTLHALVIPKTGTPWVCISCDAHSPYALALAADWHPFGKVCGMPGTKWCPGEFQGEGTCRWPDGERAEAAESKVLTA